MLIQTLYNVMLPSLNCACALYIQLQRHHGEQFLEYIAVHQPLQLARVENEVATVLTVVSSMAGLIAIMPLPGLHVHGGGGGGKSRLLL